MGQQIRGKQIGGGDNFSRRQNSSGEGCEAQGAQTCPHALPPGPRPPGIMRHFAHDSVVQPLVVGWRH